MIILQRSNIIATADFSGDSIDIRSILYFLKRVFTFSFLPASIASILT